MNKQIEELGKEIHSNCPCGLFEDEAESIAKFVIEEQGYRKQSDVAKEIIQIAKNGAEKYIKDITLNEGIRNMLSIMLDDFIDELRKKYGVQEDAL